MTYGMDSFTCETPCSLLKNQMQTQVYRVFSSVVHMFTLEQRHAIYISLNVNSIV